MIQWEAEQPREIPMNVDPEKVRTRAYFHHLNGTGCSRDDAVANWLQAEYEQRLFEVALRIQPYVCALLCADENHRGPEGILTGGTGTFIATTEGRFILTAEHVTTALFRPGIRALMTVGNGKSPTDISHLRDRVSADVTADIAAISLPEDFDIDSAERRFCRVPEWPTPRAAKGEVAFFLGYPGLHRRIEDGGVHLGLAPFCDFVSSVSERHFVLADEELERVVADFSQAQLTPFGSLGGVSGSAVFVNRAGALVPVGVIYEAGHGMNTFVFATHADRISAAGQAA